MDVPSWIVDIAVPLATACACGAAIGWDREVRRKSAGLRTHMMVALGAATFTIAALAMVDLAAVGGPSHSDPTRILQGIVGGIGFLGAGQIIQSRGSVRGMTTAAGLWVVGAVGVACGSRRYALAALTVGFALVILNGVGRLETRIGAGRGRREPT
jgi:putative Mg2+ transporter-C (MgtC) family protein